jgi:hypothetical protein
MIERLHPQSAEILRQLVKLHGVDALVEVLAGVAGNRSRIEPTDEDRRIDPDVQIIGDNLMALIAIREACHRLAWRGEWFLCTGLVIELATLVESETPADGALHKIVADILEEL